jgi:hypothetical protein
VLIITGMGRSGTSLMAQFCRLLGFDPGGYMEPGGAESINAGMEDPPLTWLNDEIEMEMRQKGQVTVSHFAARIRRYDRGVVKDPRFLGPWGRGGALLDVWWTCRQDLRLLVLTRAPSDVVKSWQAHATCFKAHLVDERGSTLSSEELALRVEQTATDFFSVAYQLGVPFRQLQFPDFIHEFDVVYDHLVDFAGLKVQRSSALATWKSLVDPKKVRQSELPCAAPLCGSPV